VAYLYSSINKQKLEVGKANIYEQGTVILVNKPLEWTSFDVVNKLRYAIKKKYQLKKIKVGHAGTLDPLATGLLIICTGKKTKDIDQYQGQDKIYSGCIYLGATTPSYDRETAENATFETNHITEELILITMKQFEGDIEQFPPIFSAIKQDGEALYVSARKGIVKEVASRRLHISYFKATKIEMPYLYFEAKCSKGTYIRSLAYDLGKALGSGGYLYNLCRDAIGDFDLKNAKSVDEMIGEIENSN
jgi:tRNA pseudouridine55 synthase